jgi:hypothetical protein
MNAATNAWGSRAAVGRPTARERFFGGWRLDQRLAALVARLRGAAGGSERFADAAAGATDRELARLNRPDRLTEIERGIARHQVGLRRPL